MSENLPRGFFPFFCWGKGFLNFFVFAASARLSSLITLPEFLPSSSMESCQSLSKVGWFSRPQTVAMKVSQELGRPSTTVCTRSSSSTIIPIAMSRWKSRRSVKRFFRGGIVLPNSLWIESYPRSALPVSSRSASLRSELPEWGRGGGASPQPWSRI